jgi:hypothetical protein
MSGIVSTDVIFSFTYLCTQYFTIFTLLHHISTSSHLPLEPTYAIRTCFTFLFFDFAWEKKKKNDIFVWHYVKIATQGVFLWSLHVYMYYSMICFIHLFFFLVPLSASYDSFNWHKILYSLYGITFCFFIVDCSFVVPWHLQEILWL